MRIRCPHNHRPSFWILYLLVFLGSAQWPEVMRAAETIDRHDDTVSVTSLIERLHNEIADQVDRKKLPEDRLAKAERLRRSFAKRQIELDAQLDILKIDALAEPQDRAALIEAIIQTARVQERMAFEYLIRLQRLRNPSAEFDPASIETLPPVRSAPARTTPNSGSAFTFEWVPEDLSTGTHD